MAAQAARVLKGERPGEIPVETVVSYDLLINSKIAREIGLSIPPAILARASKVIED